MSLKEYHKARGVRSYDLNTKKEEERNTKVITPIKTIVQEDQIKELTASIDGELDESFGRSVQFGATTSNYSPGKTHRDSIGKISMNPELVSQNTGRALRTSMEKTDYLKNLLYKRSEDEVNSSIDFQRSNNIKIVDNANQVFPGLHSINPKKHSYAKEVDFIKPRRLGKMMVQQSFDYDSAR